MKRITSVCLVTFALLRAIALLGVCAAVAMAHRPIPMPTATVTVDLAYTYDNANRRTGLTLPDGKSQSWGYDAAGRVNSLTQAGSSPNTYTVSHNGAGDLSTLPAPNGGEQTWSYDGAGGSPGPPG